MTQRKIHLTVTFEARYVGEDFDAMLETTVQESIELTIPRIDSKYVVLPKVLEGATTAVIAGHNAKVSAFFDKKHLEEMRQRERAGMLPFPDFEPDADADNDSDDEEDDEDEDAGDEDDLEPEDEAASAELAQSTR